MQQIINGHLYDTDLAREVADNSEWLEPMKSPTGGRCKVTETLYREIALKPGVNLSEARSKTSWGGFTWDDAKIDHEKGAFFLVIGFGWSGNDSATIHPMTEDEAKHWFERYHGNDVKEYTRVFGAPSTCLPEYSEKMEQKLCERDNEIKKLKDELATTRETAMEWLKTIQDPSGTTSSNMEEWIKTVEEMLKTTQAPSGTTSSEEVPF